MRTLTAIALAITMLAGVTAAQATTIHDPTRSTRSITRRPTKSGSESKGSKDSAPAK
mgnify:CR=1 FL=1